MLTQEDRIHLIRDNRTVLLNRMFDELCRRDQEARPLSRSRTPARGLFLLALQQVVDSFTAVLLMAGKTTKARGLGFASRHRSERGSAPAPEAGLDVTEHDRVLTFLTA